MKFGSMRLRLGLSLIAVLVGCSGTNGSDTARDGNVRAARQALACNPTGDGDGEWCRHDYECACGTNCDIDNGVCHTVEYDSGCSPYAKSTYDWDGDDNPIESGACFPGCGNDNECATGFHCTVDDDDWSGTCVANGSGGSGGSGGASAGAGGVGGSPGPSATERFLADGCQLRTGYFSSDSRIVTAADIYESGIDMHATPGGAGPGPSVVCPFVNDHASATALDVTATVSAGTECTVYAEYVNLSGHLDDTEYDTKLASSAGELTFSTLTPSPYEYAVCSSPDLGFIRGFGVTESE